jgi:hypothetical protein
LVDSASAATTA